MTTLKIEVTAQDIAKGNPNLCQKCPIALALNRALGVTTAGIGYGVVWESCDKEWPAPKEAMEFAKAFDHGEPVSPFSFELTI